MMKTLQRWFHKAVKAAKTLYHKVAARLKSLTAALKTKTAAALRRLSVHRATILRTVAVGAVLLVSRAVWQQSPTAQAVVKSAIGRLRGAAIPTARQIIAELRPVRVTRPAVVEPQLGGVTAVAAEEIPAHPVLNGR